MEAVAFIPMNGLATALRAAKYAESVPAAARPQAPAEPSPPPRPAASGGRGSRIDITA
ncbi:MAG: hypothetical protein OHK0024_26260 [Thalassobaculales bacterium]